MPEQTAVVDSTATVQENIVSFATNLSSMNTDDLISWCVTNLISVGSKIALALVIYIIGKWLIKRLVAITNKIFDAKGVELSLKNFIVSLIKISLTIILILTTVGVLGINTTSFLAIFASAGLAIGMALSGTLQNFAGGVLILFLKPFKVGDVIDAQGFTGTVKEISLFSTLLNTLDNKTVILPNGGLSTSAVNNYSKEPLRRVQWTIGVAYGTDYSYAKSLIEKLLNEHSATLKEEGTFIALNELGDSSLNIVARAWCKAEDYWTLYFDINEQVYNCFNEENIEFPFPQMEVHLNQKH